MEHAPDSGADFIVRSGWREAAGFIIVATSLDANVCDADEVLALYRTRWQIELAFKRLKSLIHIDRLPGKESGLAKASPYSHLIFALLIDTLSRNALDSPPVEQVTKRRNPSIWRVQRLLIEAVKLILLGRPQNGNAHCVAYRLFDPPRQNACQMMPMVNPP